MNRPVAVITGASSGIGEVFARKLAPDHDLVLIARRKDRLEQLAAQLESGFGSGVTVLPADLTKEAELACAARRIAEIDNLALLVNNAGFGSRGVFWEAELDGQEQMHRLHVMATVRLTHAALGKMVRQNAGGIVNVASVSAFLRISGSASYGATKSWMTAFTEGLSLELKSVRSAVRVQALCPGYTYSEFHDVLRLDRKKVAPSSLWTSAEFVVDASLKGLQRGKLLVVPGWRYQVLVSLLSKLPTPLRLAAENAASRARANSE